MYRLLIALIAIAYSLQAMATTPNEVRWLDRKEEGFFWYKDPAKEQEEEVKEEPVPSPSITVSPQQGPTPLSSAWIRENLQFYLDAAIDEQTPESIAAFLYIQRYAMDKSFGFMDAVQEVTLGNSGLDEIVRRPTATFANRKLDETATTNSKHVIHKISALAGIFFFTDGSDASNAQSEILSMLNRNYRFDSVEISVVDLPSDLGIRKDYGHAQQMGITSLPAIVLLHSDGLFDVISQAPVSYPDLQKRILVGAKRLGIITESEYNSTRPISNITNTIVTIPNQPMSKPSYVPIPANQIIKAFNVSR